MFKKKKAKKPANTEIISNETSLTQLSIPDTSQITTEAILNKIRNNPHSSPCDLLVALFEDYIQKNKEQLTFFQGHLKKKSADLLLAQQFLGLLRPNQYGRYLKLGTKKYAHFLDHKDLNHDALFKALPNEPNLNHFIGHLNLRGSTLNPQSTPAQILRTFFGLYQQYGNSLSEELKSHLNIIDTWNHVISGWVSSALTILSGSDYNRKKQAAEKLTHLKNWSPATADFQPVFTEIMFSVLRDYSISSSGKAVFISSLQTQSPWIETQEIPRLMEVLLTLSQNPSFDIQFAADETLRFFINQGFHSSCVDKHIKELQKHIAMPKTYPRTNHILRKITSSVELASSNTHLMLMEYFAPQLLEISDRAVKESICRLLSKLNAPLPDEIKDRLIKEMVDSLSTHRYIRQTDYGTYEDILKLLIRFKSDIPLDLYDPLLDNIFHCMFNTYREDVHRPVLKLLSQLSVLMTMEKRREIINDAFNVLHRNPSALGEYELRVKTVKIISSLIPPMPVATHDKFFNILFADFFNGLPYEIENIFLSTDWHLLNETRVRVIKEMLNVLGMRHNAVRNNINLALSLISALATDIPKEESQHVVDMVLDIIKDKNSHYSTRVTAVESLRKLHNQLQDDMQLTVMEHLTAFLKNKKRKQEVKKAIIVLITELHQSGTIIPLESLLPVIHQLIKRKSTKLSLLTSICHFLFQVKEDSFSEYSAAIVLDLIDKVKDESIPLQDKTVLYETIFSLRFWLAEPQRVLLLGDILDALLLLQTTNGDKESYHILVVLMCDFFNTHERIKVIGSLIRKVDDPDREVRSRVYSLIMTYADHMTCNEKIHLLSRLYVLAHLTDDDYANDAKSRFIDVSNGYHRELNRELTVKVLHDNADQHDLPLPNELTEHILSFTRL